MVKKLLSVILSIIMVLSLFTVCASASSTTLRFNSNGKFKIVVFADTQDDSNPDERMMDFICQALDYEQPDLVAFTGDNLQVSLKTSFSTGARKLLQPLIDRNIPYAYTFGNHDAETLKKDYMHSVYLGLGDCLTYNADPSISGYGNCNIPIYASNGNAIAFNLWFIDSNMYDSLGYDNVHQDQLDWFVRTDMALEQSQGHKVNSIVFQHIALPEIYNLLTESSSGSKTYMGKKYSLNLNSNAHGYLGEFPCPPAENSGEFDVLKSRGDVLGVVTGHDHSNSFVGTYQGIDFIQMPGMSFRSYGDDQARGYGVIELDERDTSTYTSRTVRYIDRDFIDVESYDCIKDDYYSYNSGSTFISDIQFKANSKAENAKSELTSNGYTVVDFDLNKGAGGDYIYMGYKTTTNYADAIKDIRFYSGASGTLRNTIDLRFNGQPITYYVCSTDLNKGASGDYVYCYYSKDGVTGSALTSISFSTEASGTGNRTCGYLARPDSPAELNKGTTKHLNSIYCLVSSSGISSADYSSLFAAYNELAAYKNPADFSASTTQSFNSKFAELENTVNSVSSMRASDKSTAQLDNLINETRKACAEVSDYTVQNGFIYGFSKPMTAQEFSEGFSEYSEASVRPTGRFVGTGSTVDLFYGEYISSYKTVTFGDVNGDGWYDGQDSVTVSCLANGMLTREQVGEAQYMAADCNHDGVIDDFDVAILKEAGILLSSVDQSMSNDELLQTSSEYVEYLSLIDQTPTVPEDEANTPTEDEKDDKPLSFFERVAEFIQSIFRFIVSYIPAPLVR